MIIHAKPIAYGLGERCYSDWHFRGGIDAGKAKKGVDTPTDEPKEEFIKEEEFKV